MQKQRTQLMRWVEKLDRLTCEILEVCEAQGIELQFIGQTDAIDVTNLEIIQIEHRDRKFAGLITKYLSTMGSFHGFTLQAPIAQFEFCPVYRASYTTMHDRASKVKPETLSRHVRAAAGSGRRFHYSDQERLQQIEREMKLIRALLVGDRVP